jgi:protein O-GlcNAc transferase
MKVRWFVFPVVILAVAVAGCQNNKKQQTPKQEAEQRWSSARAAVLGSLAKGQMEAGNFEKSRQTLEEAKRLDPQNPGLRILHAKLAIEQGQLEVADRELAEARKMAPTNAEIDYLSGIVHQRWLKSEVAFEFYTSAAEKDRSEVAYVLAQAEMLVQLGRQQQALLMLQSRLEDFGTSSVMYDTIGQLHIGMGSYAPAVDALRQASILASDDLMIREHLAMAHFYNGQYRDAAEQFNRVMRDEKNAKRPELYLALGECQMKLGRAREARESFDKAATLNPSSVMAWMSLTRASLDLNDTRRADNSLKKAVALAPQEAEVHLLLGYIRLRQDRLSDALTAFRKAQVLDPADPVSLCMIGYVLERSGRPDQAVQFYGRALKISPDDELATRLMASVDAGD